MSARLWSGVVEMTSDRYRYLAGLAQDNLLTYRPIAYSVSGLYDGEEEKAVYVAANCDGLACYTGQTRPSKSWTGAAGIRLRQHLTDLSKQLEWDTFWVFPLKWSTKPTVVDWYEDTVAARLMLPLRQRSIAS